MATFSEARYSNIAVDDRMDAEYYRQEFLDSLSKLTNVTGISLVPLEDRMISLDFKKSVIFGERTRFYGKKGIPFVRVSDVRNSTIDENELVFVPVKMPGVSGIAFAEPGNVVITESGTIGNAGILPESYPKWALSGDIICIVPNPRIRPEYLTAFLQTTYGRNQMLRGKTQQVQPHLYVARIKKTLIPVPPPKFQLSITKMVKEAFVKGKTADSLYEKAKSLLMEQFGFSDLKIDRKKAYEVRFSQIVKYGRFDVEYHNPIHSMVKSLLDENSKKGMFEIKRLSDLGRISKGIEVGSTEYADTGYLFLRVSNLSEVGLRTEDSCKYIRPILYEELQSGYQPKVNEILFSKDASVGIATTVRNDFPKAIISGGIVRIKPRQIDPYYLALTLNSVVCRSQAERNSIGTVIKHLNFENVKKLLVPIISETHQEKISDLVRESIRLRKESTELLGNAVTQVERFVDLHATRKPMKIM